MRWARLIARTFEHGHRGMCGGGLVVGLLDVLELEAVVEVVQSQAENWSTYGGGGGVRDLRLLGSLVCSPLSWLRLFHCTLAFLSQCSLVILVNGLGMGAPRNLTRFLVKPQQS